MIESVPRETQSSFVQSVADRVSHGATLFTSVLQHSGAIACTSVAPNDRRICAAAILRTHRKSEIRPTDQALPFILRQITTSAVTPKSAAEVSEWEMSLLCRSCQETSATLQCLRFQMTQAFKRSGWALLFQIFLTEHFSSNENNKK